MLYIMVGLPGSGKSTVIKKLTVPCVIVSTDAIRKELTGSEESQHVNGKVFELAYARTEKALKERKDVVFDATSLTKKSRKPLIEIAGRAGTDAVAVFMSVSLDECLERNSQRERYVPEYVIRKMCKRASVPTVQEGFASVIVKE